MARAAKKKETKQVSMEEALWDAADEMRGSVEYPVYKQVVLGLVFLKFVSDRFERRKQELIAEGKEKMVEQAFAYTMKNVFYLPEKARWSYLATEAAKQSDLKVQLDNAMDIIEKNNETLKGALPSNFYVTVDLDVSKLASLIDIMNGVDLSKDEEEDVIGRVYEYFLSKFSSKEGKGEFYTPKPIVKIITDNPALGKGIAPKDTVKIVKALREEEISAFLDLMDTEDFKWRCLVYLLAYTGIRRSEACALAWKDVDFAGSRFYVVQSASKVIGGGVEVGYTKTNMSTRDEPLNEPLRGMLWDLRQQEGSVGYVFKNVYNAHEPMHPDSVTNFFAKFCRKWGIRDITPHMLRRSMASVMNRNGIDTKTAQKILGHTDSRTTSKYYLNSDSLDVQNAFDVLGKAIGSKRGTEESVELLKECNSLLPVSEAPAVAEKAERESPELPKKSGDEGQTA
ncbi:MAG: hypothetical protein EOM93_06300 [Gammaproteobacteria bacterium]|jgi:integrase|nr:hypothetical protein [Gammaproteobacteria bacterium]